MAGLSPSRPACYSWENPLLLFRSFACTCGHGPHKHPDGTCELCQCNGFIPSPLRKSNAHPNLKDFWRDVGNCGLSDENADALISGALSFVDAHTLQQNTAIVRKGSEIPGHAAFKRRLHRDKRNRLLQECLEDGRWSDRKIEATMSSLCKSLISLAVLLASGETLDLSADSFRREYRKLSSRAVGRIARKYKLPVPRRGVSAKKLVKSPRD